MRTIVLFKGTEFESNFYSAYSKFKHGSKAQARLFGKKISEICNFEKDCKLICYSAPYDNIPTASNAFKDFLLLFCSSQFLEKNIRVKQGKIHRAYSYDKDYGLMSKEQRENAISSDLFNIDTSFIGGDEFLVFIDDIKITGSHEKRIHELIKREKITNKVIFIYIAEYIGGNVQVEHLLNSNSVNTLEDIDHLIRNEGFIFNTRVIKFILKAPAKDFISFIMSQSNSFKETLFCSALLNNYHTNDIYRVNFEALRSVYECLTLDSCKKTRNSG
jgi:hypothetical protein